ncbi:MAG: cell division protein FtsL [Gammaproteobacteria bacterium]
MDALRLLLWPVLIAVLLGSALAVIYNKYQSRLLFIEIQKLERESDEYEVEWGQLQLEMTTLGEHSRVERLARRKLGLVTPLRENIIFIKP